jgi:photosystem II stability/assembly factor-like uncharacterized protein
LKQTFTLILLVYCNSSFSQWTREQRLPASDISSLYKTGNSLYAGGKAIVYFSIDKGQTWDSTKKIPGVNSVDNVVVHKNEIYASSFQSGVYKSIDQGQHWVKINDGLFAHVSDFCEFKGDLYAATLGGAVFKLNPIARTSWMAFSDGVSAQSANITSIVSNSHSLIAGTIANGMYDFLSANTTTWEERFLLGRITPSEGVYDIITAHDSMLLAGHTGRYYLSTDNGLSWNIFGERVESLQSTLANTKQALLLSTTDFDGVNNNTDFFIMKKDALTHFTGFSFAPHHFTYATEIFGDKYWDASTEGLFFMSLSDLPGVTTADDTVSVAPLPMRFISFDAACNGDEIILAWRTAGEEKISDYHVEKTSDRIHWTGIGERRKGGDGNSETEYSFIDGNPLQHAFYRIAANELTGQVHYSPLKEISCGLTDGIEVFPNPVHDKLMIRLSSAAISTASVKIYDSKGSLVKLQKINLVAGVNEYTIEMGSLANGVYHLWAEWHNGQIQKTLQILKR